jgi:short-subunit dehydrogenase
VPLDLSRLEDVTRAYEVAVQSFGRIDILINNAGISQRSLTVDTDLEVYAKIMNINYLGTVAVTKSVLPEMIERGSGQVVTITSLVGKFGTPFRSGYAASKHALHGFFDSLRAEIHTKGINVLLVCPGFIQTDISKNALVGNGDNQGTMDSAQENGMTPAVFVQRLITAMNSNKEEVCIGGKETYGIWIKRFFPGLFSKMIRNVKVT